LIHKNWITLVPLPSHTDPDSKSLPLYIEMLRLAAVLDLPTAEEFLSILLGSGLHQVFGAVAVEPNPES
jgi:hypothetical protein